MSSTPNNHTGAQPKLALLLTGCMSAALDDQIGSLLRVARAASIGWTWGSGPLRLPPRALVAPRRLALGRAVRARRAGTGLGASGSGALAQGGVATGSPPLREAQASRFRSVSARFSDELRTAVNEIWEAQHEHPVVRGIGAGSLSVEDFSRYVRQDYLFLIEYARLLALGVARAPDLDTMRRFAALAQAILGEEMELHRAFAVEFGITDDELEAEQPARQTRAYTDFLLRIAATGDFAELAAALLPCMWGYAEIGQRLAERRRAPDPRYARWVETYASDEFAAQAAWCRELVDRLASDVGNRGRGRMLNAFVTCSRYELEFWDTATG